MKKPNAKFLMSASLELLKNPELKCMPDQITGKTYALCLMETDSPDEKRIARIISPFFPPKELTAFIMGYYQAMCDNCFD